MLVSEEISKLKNRAVCKQFESTNKIKFYVISLLIFLSVVYFSLFHLKLIVWKIPFLITDNDVKENYNLKFNNYGFYPLNDKGVYSFWNVCIETVNAPLIKHINAFGKQIQYEESKKIVVYNSFYRDGVQDLSTVGSANSYSHEWAISFRTRPIPAGHKFNPVTAFFIVPTCPANFHHFWIDEFVPLFTMIRQGNRLKPGSNNVLVYKQPMDLEKNFVRDCTNISTFRAFLKILHIKSHDTFFKFPDGTCFSSGVFGTTTAYLSNPRDAVDYSLESFFGKQQNKNEDCTILFLDRNTRKILNIQKLMSIAKSVSSLTVCRFVFENLKVEQQMHAASQARVMIGVQGSGLQWAVFMRPSSHVIEIAWPQKHWGFYFQNYVTQYGIRHHKIIAANIRPNWTTYENQVRRGMKVKMEERLAILAEDGVRNSFDHFWKWADVIVTESDFLEVFSDVMIEM